MSLDSPSLAPAPPARSSSLPSSSITRFPYLPRLDIGLDMFARQNRPPLLALRLSSTSFLDSFVHDDFTQEPLYVIKTVGSSTTVSRADPWEGFSRTAIINWGQGSQVKGKKRDECDGAVILMNQGHWKPVSSFLKTSSLASSRKFNIPNYPRSLKWKRVGSAYHCTTYSVKGPVATFDPSVSSVVPACLRVYETFHEKHDSRPQWDHGGVSIVLLDYLLLSSLLLVTQGDEWRRVGQPEGTDTNSTDISPATPATLPDHQWRKIVYGEPLYPTIRSPSPTPSTDTSHWDTNSQSSGLMYFGNSLLSNSPFNESSTCLSSIPPVPSLPSQYRSSIRRVPSELGPRELQSHSPSADMMHAIHPELPWVPRPRSTPLIEPPSSSSPITYFGPTSAIVNPRVSWTNLHTRADSIGSAHGIVHRRLPAPPVSPQTTRPSTSPSMSMPSSTGRRSEKRLSQFYSRSLPPIPPTLPATTHGRVGPSHTPETPESPQYSHQTMPVRPVFVRNPAVMRKEAEAVEAEEVANWMRDLRIHGPRSPARETETIVDMPPPAYNAIDFSRSHLHSSAVPSASSYAALFPDG